MAVDVLAWNLADGLSHEDRAQGIVEAVTSQKPTVAVFPEAWQESETKFLDLSLEEFDAAGYESIQILYEDSEERSDRHGLLGIVRKEAVGWGNFGSRAVRMVGRNAIFLSVVDRDWEQYISVYGVHLNDRDEVSRVEQADALLQHIGDDDRVVVAGDFNASYRNNPIGRVLRLTRPLFESVPVIDYKPGIKPSKIHHVADRLRRASQMAIGTTLEEFESNDFYDADPKHRATAGPLNIDHIMVKGLDVEEHRVLPKNAYSDHRAIIAKLL